MIMRMKNVLLLSWMFVLIFVMAACRKSEEPRTQQTNADLHNAATPPATAVDKERTGSIAGTISFTGPSPRLPMLEMTQDPACPSKPQNPEVVAVSRGKLANVFVYVKDGLGNTVYSVPATPVVLDQKECRYIPHVLGLRVGQPLEVRNADTASHNVHPMPAGGDEEWNESQMPGASAIVRTFHHSEIMLPVHCNQHPWMKAYLNIMTHPFFSVSRQDGTFLIQDLPPGDYTLAAVHEKFGEQTMRVKVISKETAQSSFIFTGKP
jgi:plastocyanin